MRAIAGKLQSRGLESLFVDFSCSVVILSKLTDSIGIDVEPDNFELPSERDRQRQADIAEPDDDDPFAHGASALLLLGRS